MSKTRKNKNTKNKTINNKTKCKIKYIPAADKDIKAIIDINAIRNNIKCIEQYQKHLNLNK